MLTVLLCRTNDVPRTVAFDRSRLAIGRLPSNDVVLDSTRVSPHHAELRRDGEHYVAMDLGSREGTFVRGARIGGPTVVMPGDPVKIGPCTLEVVASDALSREPEEALTTMIREQPHEDAPRLVYADWLEERGRHAGAEFLRLGAALKQMHERDPELPAATARLRQLSAVLPLAWRTIVARPLIERCGPFELVCPKAWDGLTRTDRDDVRFCSICESHVYYCGTLDEAREHARKGECVAVDGEVPRTLGDLDRPPDSSRYMTVGMIVSRD